MKTVLTIIALMLTTIVSFAQEPTSKTVSYSYDYSGNRYKREIILDKVASINNKPNNNLTNEVANPEQKQLVIKDKIDDFEITIYPNPTEGKLSLNVSNMQPVSDNNVMVFDLYGKKLYDVPVGSETTELDLSMQPSGSYIMKVIIADKTAVWKIIKK